MKQCNKSKLLIFGCVSVFAVLFLLAGSAFGQQGQTGDESETGKEVPVNESIIQLKANMFGLGTVAELLGLVKCTDTEINSVKVKQCTSKDLRQIMFRLIQIALGFTSLIALVFVLYGGFTWATAGGSEERVGRGKKILIWALTGLFVIIIAWSIVTYVMFILSQVV